MVQDLTTWCQVRSAILHLQAREKALKMVSTLPEKVITLSWAPGSEQDIPAPVWKRNISGTFLQRILSV